MTAVHPPQEEFLMFEVISMECDNVKSGYNPQEPPRCRDMYPLPNDARATVMQGVGGVGV